MITEAEIWQVEVNGQIYETNFDELVQWISEGAVIREDKVRRGNLRWLEAGRVPKLTGFFNNRDLNITPEIVPPANNTEFEMPPVSVSINVDPAQPQVFSQTGFSHQKENVYSKNNFQNYTETQIPAENSIEQFPINPNACHFHQDTEPTLVCENCSVLFCSACPKTYGGTVRTCPLCGSFCRVIAQMQAAAQKNFNFQKEMDEGFGVSDFGKALAYPMRFKTSLIAGGIMFMFFTIGQSATSFGGIFMLFGAIFCMLLTNMLTFGILANTVNNFSQGLTDRNFMPSFDDFELWNDVIHPFFLSIGVYIVSFGLFAVLIIGAIWYVASSFSAVWSQQTNLIESQIEPGSAEQSPFEKQRPEILNNNGQIPGENPLADAERNAKDEEAEFQRLQNMIDNHRKNQLESVVGKEPELNSGPYSPVLDNLAKSALPFLILAFGSILWGFFYFPAACLVAGYSRSFVATINPTYGFDTIRRLGVDYFKILLMCVLLLIFSGAISIALNIVLRPFNLPLMGNLPAIALGSLSTFYFSIVFSVLLGFALYKNSAKFNFFNR